MRIVITGCSGHLGQVVMTDLLSSLPGCAITGVDTRAPDYQHERFHFQCLNVADPALGHCLTGADAVIHLAFVLLNSGGGQDQPGLNLAAARNLASSVLASDVPLLIHMSSAAVYGPWPDTPDPVSEQCPPRPLPGFRYAQDKVQVEQMLTQAYRQAQQSGKQGRLLILRPPTILGPHAHPYLTGMLQSPFRLGGYRGRARTQCIHEQDVAEAIRRCLLKRLSGIYNLAAEPTHSLNAWQARAGGGYIPLPWWLASIGLARNWRRAGGQGKPGWMQGLGYNLILDSTALYDALGWQPQHEL